MPTSFSTVFTAIAVFLFLCSASLSANENPERPDAFIGYTELRTDLPGGRHANVRTMRAKVMSARSGNSRELAAEFVISGDHWTQFAGWSPDGRTAIVTQGWQDPENAILEEKLKSFHFTKDGWLLDSLLIDIATGSAENVTAVDRVSFYNGGLFYWPGDDSRLGFTALIDGNSHPFRMDRSGRNKIDLTKGSNEFTYGFSSSPNGERVAYHKDYQVFLADADGSNAVQIMTGQPFNFGPAWSPDGKWVMFVSGEHYNCHPHVVRADGTGLTKIADRAGYRGVVEFLDVPDFHGGSSDLPIWSADSQRIYFTARADESVELFAAGLDGIVERLTASPAGTLHYHPELSADGGWLVYGSKRDGVRQLCIMETATRKACQITQLESGHAAMWPHWQPVNATNPIAR
jgi:TolB protein